MKKTVSLLLLFVFLFNTVGYFIAFMYIQYEIRNEARNKIEGGIIMDELSVIVIQQKDIKNIQWLDEGKEARYNNRMYDVVKRIDTDKSITLYCIDDTKESSLCTIFEKYVENNIMFDDLMEEEDDEENDSKKKTAHSIFKLYFSGSQSVSLHTKVSDLLFPTVGVAYLSAPIDNDFLPPEFA